MLNEPTLVTGAILSRGSLRAAIYDRLTRSLGKEPETATPRDIYDALSLAVREELSARWLATQRRVARARVKRLCYLSVEFLPGRSLVNALSSLDSELIDEARAAVASMGHDFDSVLALEVDPGLGNGGLGRLAACFLDSLATLQYPATGYGIRYDYGIFTQIHRHRRRAARVRQHLVAAAQRVGDPTVGRAIYRAFRRASSEHSRCERYGSIRAGWKPRTSWRWDSTSSCPAIAARR